MEETSQDKKCSKVIVHDFPRYIGTTQIILIPTFYGI